MCLLGHVYDRTAARADIALANSLPGALRRVRRDLRLRRIEGDGQALGGRRRRRAFGVPARAALAHDAGGAGGAYDHGFRQEGRRAPSTDEPDVWSGSRTELNGTDLLRRAWPEDNR